MKTNQNKIKKINSLLLVAILHFPFISKAQLRVNSAGAVSIGNSSSTTGSLFFYNATNSNTVTINSGVSTVSYGLTLPLAQSAASKTSILTNDGTGQLSWADNNATSWLLTGNTLTTNPTNTYTVSPINGNFIGTRDTKDFAVATNNLERLRVLSNGNVGIGTAVPTGLLDVKLAANKHWATVLQGGITTLQANNDAGSAFVEGKVDASGLYLNSVSGGNVGIGTAAPITPLSVNANNWTTLGESPIITAQTGTTNVGGMYITAENTSGFSGLGFKTLCGGCGNLTTKLYIDHTGNVGIGTTSPNYKLETVITDAATNTIEYPLSIDHISSATTVAGFGVGINFKSTNFTTQPLEIARIRAYQKTTNTSKMTFSTIYGNNNFVDALTIDNGYVGIGITSPGYVLDINGTAHCTAGIWSSDKQFKTNIDTIRNVLGIIKQLKPKTYYFDTTNVWGFKFPSEKQYGFIAQDLEEVLPELVKSSSKPADTDSLGNIVHPAITYKSVYYLELIAFLTKGMQEQQQKIDTLQSKANNQASINTSLQKQLITNNTIFQNQLNELQTAINNCCNRPIQSSVDSKSLSEGATTQIDVKLNDVQTIVLEQNVPNPFAEQTTINYSLPDNTLKAQMLFYNSSGKLIQSVELIQKGKGILNVFASDLSSGIYTYTLVVDGQITETKKMVKQ
jgi:hypothetical protein